MVCMRKLCFSLKESSKHFYLINVNLVCIFLIFYFLHLQSALRLCSCALEEFHYYYYYYYYYYYKGFDNLKLSDRECDKFLIFILGKFIQGYALTSEGYCVSCSVSHLFSSHRKEKKDV